MEAEHRELGLGDPTLGKHGAQAGRRAGAAGSSCGATPSTASATGREAARDSLYREATPSADALAHSAAALRALWSTARASAARPDAGRREDRDDRPLRPSACARPDPRRRAARARRRRGGARRDRRAARPAGARPARGACDALRANGELVRARRAGSPPSLEQSCVVTGEPVAGACRRAVRASSSCPSPQAGAPDEEIELGEAIATSSSTTARRSTSAARSPTRWRSASTPIRAARAPTRRSRKRAC